MPDWSYHSIFKPLLFKLPPKISRDITFGALHGLSRLPWGPSLIRFLGHMDPPAEIKKSILGIEFSSPVGWNGRLDPDLKAVRAMLQFGFGFIEVGPVTLKPVKEGEVTRRIDNQEIGYERLVANSGLENTYQMLSKLNMNNTKIIIRVWYEGDLHAIHIMMDRLWAMADLFIVEGLDGSDVETFRSLKERYSSIPLFVGVQAERNDLLQFLQLEPDGMVLDDAMGRSGAGYWIGPESKTRSIKAIRQLREENPSIPIIASGGITEPQDALDLLQAGADLIPLHSGMVYGGPGLPKRINEALTARYREDEFASFKEWGWLFLMGLGVFLAGIIAMVFALSSVILPYDENFLGLTREQLKQLNPKLFSFMSHDRNTLAGVMISAGFLYMQLAYHGIRKKVHWARKAYIIAGIFGFLNFFYFIGFGYFDILHFIYNLILLPFFMLGVRFSRHMRKGESGWNVRNHRDWKRSQIGQFCFVVIGFSLLLGGMVISTIGMTTVFVPTDLLYFQLGPADIHRMDPQLIPLIAHDRAGFGGALLSEGFMILCISLWGFREGEKWVWWTLFVGGLPGFLAGIGTHFHIGYTDFLHLLPAYFLFVLYSIGLLYSFRYLHIRVKSP